MDLNTIVENPDTNQFQAKGKIYCQTNKKLNCEINREQDGAASQFGMGTETQDFGHKTLKRSQAKLGLEI